jgi:transcriptional regulator with XRE-family HTH domain
MLLNQTNKNQLLLVRSKQGFEQKQIALLLGHKTVDQISRFERGVKLPSLKTAIKLEIIYNLPIPTLFYGYYELYRSEILGIQKNHSNGKENKITRLNINYQKGAEFCAFEEKLKSLHATEKELEEARVHITELINRRTALMNHQ